MQEIGVDARVLGFTFGVSLLTGIIFGLLPAWTASRSGVGESLKEGGRSATAGSARQRLRSTFVVVELAVALILLVGAGLLIKTFWNLRSVEPGFNPDHLLTMRVELPEARYKEIDKQTRFRTQALAAINSLPGVQAAMVSELPLSGDSLDHDFVIEGRPPIAPGDEPSLETRSVMGDYFHSHADAAARRPRFWPAGFRCQRAARGYRERRDGAPVFSQRGSAGQTRSLGARSGSSLDHDRWRCRRRQTFRSRSARTSRRSIRPTRKPIPGNDG